MKLAHEDRYVSSHSRRHSDFVTDLPAPSTPRNSHSRIMKRQKRFTNEIPEHYQTVPNTSSSTNIPAFMRSNSGGNMKRPLSFIAGIASRVKNAFEGWQDSGSNRQSGKWSFNGTEFESASDSSSPNAPRKSLNTYPRIKKPAEKASEDRSWQSGGRQSSRKSSNRYKSLNPSFAEVMEILSVPSSPELDPSPLRAAALRNQAEMNFDVTNDDVIKPTDLSKSGDVNVLVIGAEGVGKSALIVRYLTKRFIGEYAPNVESIYDHSITVDGKEVSIHLWDSGIPAMLQKTPESEFEKLSLLELPDILSMTSLYNSSVRSSESSASSTYDNRVSSSSFEEEVMSAFTSIGYEYTGNYDKKDTKDKRKGKKEVNNNLHKKDNDMQIRLNWCDCIVVVYSICDLESFESARDIIRYIRGQYVRGQSVSEFESGSARSSGSSESPDLDPVTRLSQIPILLVGNKADLQHRRRIDAKTAAAFSQGYGCNSVELSVTDSFEPVCKVFNSIVETIHRDKLPSKLTKIKSIVKTVSEGFGHRRNLSM